MITTRHVVDVDKSTDELDKRIDASLEMTTPTPTPIPPLTPPLPPPTPPIPPLPLPSNFSHETHLTVTSQLTTLVQELTINSQTSLATAVSIRTHLIRSALEEIESIFGVLKPNKKGSSNDNRYLGILGGERKILDLAKENAKKTSRQIEILSRPYLEAQEYIDKQIAVYDLQSTSIQREVYDKTSEEIESKSRERNMERVDELRRQGRQNEADDLLTTMKSFKNPMQEFKPQKIDVSGVVIARVVKVNYLDVSMLKEEYLKPRVADKVKIQKLATRHGVDAEEMVTEMSEEVRSDPVEMKSRLLAIKVQVDQPQIRNVK